MKSVVFAWVGVALLAGGCGSAPSEGVDAGGGGGGGGGGTPRPRGPVSKKVLVEQPVDQSSILSAWVDDTGVLFGLSNGDVISVGPSGGARTTLFDAEYPQRVAGNSSQLLLSGGFQDGGLFVSSRAGGARTRVFAQDYASFALRVSDEGQLFALVDGQLQRLTAGPGLEQVAAIGYPQDFEIRGGHVYFANFGDLRRSPLDGGADEQWVNPPDFGSLRAFAFGDDGRLYFASQSYQGADAGNIDDVYVRVDAGEYQRLFTAPTPSAYSSGDHFVAAHAGRTYWLRVEKNYNDHYEATLRVLDLDGGVHRLSGFYNPVLMERTSQGVVVGHRGQTSCFQFPCDTNRAAGQVALIQVATPDGG